MDEITLTAVIAGIILVVGVSGASLEMVGLGAAAIGIPLAAKAAG